MPHIYAVERRGHRTDPLRPVGDGLRRDGPYKVAALDATNKLRRLDHIGD
ncbi:hypothetical protein [Streptomyces griseus]|nr:hypothetical protein [Streptomyces griseus]